MPNIREKQQQKTSLALRVIFLFSICHIVCLGILAIPGHVSAGTCSNSADPLIISSNCLELTINSSKSELRVDSNGWIGTGSPTYQTPLYITSVSTLTQLDNYGVIISQTPVIGGVNAISIDAQSSIGVLNNYNLIQGDKNAISISSGSITALNNYGTIKGGSAANDHGIYLLPNVVGMPTITAINNYGTIGGYGAAIFLDTNNTGLPGVRIDAINNDFAGSISGGNLSGIVVGSNNSIGTITNSGMIESTACPGGACAHGIENWGTISGINNQNTGTIQGVSLYGGVGYGIYNRGVIAPSTSANYAINNAGLINSIFNAGTIGDTSLTTHAIINSGTIGDILNFASISGGSNGIYNSGQGLIGLINNMSGGNISSSGSGFGIYNDAARIDLLINAQNQLTYKGTLPLAYNIFINSPSSYGVLAVNSPLGQTNFNIAPGSNIVNTVYPGVVTGVNSSGFQALTGTYVSGIIRTNWNLVNSTGTTTSWDLSTVPIAVAPTVTNNQSGVVSYSGSQVAQAITLTYAAIVPNPGGVATSTVNPILANGSNFTFAAAALTTKQVNQLVDAHAEGYSSNMTIGLEQMAMISNSVLDRIHQPVSNLSSNSKSYQTDGGRYVWGDIFAFKGQVNDQNNLSGFGYNATNILLGSDIYRDKSGGFGVYGGLGYTSITESSQVVQKFNNTIYTAGLYGGYYLPQDMKISGAIGYVFGNTRADRINPSIGLFTGGTAHSEFNTNGGFAAIKLSKTIWLDERWTINPYIGSSYTQQLNGGIQESGGKDFNYSIASASSYALRTFIGADFNYSLSSFSKTPLSFVGFYRLSYNWTADKDSAHSIKATSPIFGTFNQTGSNMGPISNLFGFGLQGNLDSSTTLRVGMVSSINSNGYQIGGGGELRINF